MGILPASWVFPKKPLPSVRNSMPFARRSAVQIPGLPSRARVLRSLSQRLLKPMILPQLIRPGGHGNGATRAKTAEGEVIVEKTKQAAGNQIPRLWTISLESKVTSATSTLAPASPAPGENCSACSCSNLTPGVCPMVFKTRLS